MNSKGCDKREQELMAAVEEAYRERIEPDRKWNEAYCKLWEYRESKREGGRGWLKVSTPNDRRGRSDSE